MRLPILLLEAGLILSGVCFAQTQSNQGDSGAPTLPVGQTFLHFEFPYYQEGKLRYIFTATEAKGITLNRAETSNLKIDIYENGAVSTTITSPKADLIVAEQKMRTKNTVLIERADMEASSRDCDFDVKSKKFLMRNNVKVLLKHFDLNQQNPAGSSAPKSAAPQPAGIAPMPQAVETTPVPAPVEAPSAAPTPTPMPTVSTPSAPPTPDPTPTARGTDSLLASPGAYSDTNSAPIPPAK